MKKIALSLMVASVALFAAEANTTKAEEATKKVEEVAKKAEANATDTAAKATKEVNVQACVGCHGQNFEKAALGKSKIVKDMTKDEIVKALKGYKDGTYGGAMKGTMLPNVKNLSEDDIKAIAEKFGK